VIPAAYALCSTVPVARRATCVPLLSKSCPKSSPATLPRRPRSVRLTRGLKAHRYSRYYPKAIGSTPLRERPRTALWDTRPIEV
jgi:hypothetical protein